MALFKARLAAEAEGEDIEEKYVTSCYVIMREYGYTLEEMKNTPATTFMILLEEMTKQAEREEAEMKKSKTMK